MIDMLTTSPRIRSLLFFIRELFAEVCRRLDTKLYKFGQGTNVAAVK